MNNKAVKLIKKYGVLNPFTGHYELSTCYVNDDGIAVNFSNEPLTKSEIKDIIDTFN